VIVSELIEKLQAMPGHLPVHIEVDADGSGGGADNDYLFTLDIEVSNFPTYGRMAVIIVNKDPS